MKQLLKNKNIKRWILFFIAFSCFNIYSQEKNLKLKFFPQISLKVGSQSPHIGAQFDLSAGILLKDKYFIGLGGGYATNMGMGGKTFPLYADFKYLFSFKKSFLFKSKDEANNLLAEFQSGMSINSNDPYKTGFIASFGIAYRFDFIKIKTFKFPSFYVGPNLEYNSTSFIDEYRGYNIQDGKIKHLIFNLKIAFDINPINLKKE
jgi:hypothetical protein